MALHSELSSPVGGFSRVMSPLTNVRGNKDVGCEKPNQVWRGLREYWALLRNMREILRYWRRYH